MSLFSFARKLMGANVKQVVDEIVGAAIAANPQAATEAEMQLLREKVDEAAAKVAELNQRLNKEKAEADAKRKDLDRLIRAATHLQQKIDANHDPQIRGELEHALDEMVPQLQRCEEELAREDDDVVRVQDLLNQAQQILEERSRIWAGAREEMKRAIEDLERAKMTHEQAERRRNDAEELAKLRQSGATSGLGVAVGKLREAAAKAEQQAQATDLVTETLGRAQATASGNKHVAAALAEADQKALPGGSGRDYLKQLSDRRSAATPQPPRLMHHRSGD